MASYKTAAAPDLARFLRPLRRPRFAETDPAPGDFNEDETGAGFTRDYSEGAAYRDYFSSDRLMFEVPVTDTRLKNKAEVVVLRPGALGANSTPLAIAADKLRRTPVFPFEHDGQRLVAITSQAGANRIYLRQTHEFTSPGRDGAIVDSHGGRWRATPGALVSATGETLPAVPTHRVFWFGWIAQHPSSALIR
jgi:hypothetical protein